VADTPSLEVVGPTSLKTHERKDAEKVLEALQHLKARAEEVLEARPFTALAVVMIDGQGRYHMYSYCGQDPTRLALIGALDCLKLDNAQDLVRMWDQEDG